MMMGYTLSPTTFGLIAILLWSTLAVLAAAVGSVPPFQMTAIVFGIGGVTGTLVLVCQGNSVRWLEQRWSVWGIGVAGFFGYHALYFSALRLAPPVDAQLINYLWPLLIVVFSAFLPGARLRWHHIIGALLGFAGTLVLFNGIGIVITGDYILGYIAAFIAAFVWAIYSVIMSRMTSVPTDMVVGFYIATSVLSAFCHVFLEETAWPVSTFQWFALGALGFGPVGVAYYLWDFGTKRGDIRVLGAASYATPLLSTAFLILAGFARPSAGIAVAAVLIAGGGLVAAKDMIRKGN